MRIPLYIEFKTRLSNHTKDSRLVNGTSETKPSGEVVLSRPGVVTTGYNFSAPQALGKFKFPVLIYGDNLEVIDGPPIVDIHIGDYYPPYYAMIDNPSTLPGPGDPYWSLIAPGTDRWRVMLYWDVVDSCSLSDPDHVTGENAASKDAAVKVFVEKITSKFSPGLKVLWAYIDGDNWVCDSITYPSDPMAYTYVELYGTGRVYQDVGSRSDYIDIGTLLEDYPPSWPAGCGVWTGLYSSNNQVGIIGKKHTTSSFVVESVGTVGKITATLFYPVSAIIEISGCDQSEYNGTFNATKSFDLDGYWYITLPSNPEVTPATGTKTLTYWSGL